MKITQLEGSVRTLISEKTKLKSERFRFETITDAKQLEFPATEANEMLYGHFWMWSQAAMF